MQKGYIFFSLVINALVGGTGGYVLFGGETDHLVPVKNFIKVAFSSMLACLSACQCSSVGLVGLSRAFTTYMVTDDLYVICQTFLITTHNRLRQRYGNVF